MICAKCKHSWRADVPPANDATQIEAIVVQTIHTQEIPANSTSDITYEPLLPPIVKRIFKKVLIAVAGLFVLWFIFNRHNIAKDLAFLEPFYDMIGLHIYHTGEGLHIESVRSELVYEDGIMKLSVTGRINNTTKKTQQIPALRASAIASDGHVMQDWQIDAPAAKVAPGEEVPFHSSINSPKGTVVDINLNFIEKSPDAP